MGLLGTLIINPVIHLTFVYLRVQLIEKSKFMMTVILKIFYETKKNTVSPNYSKIQKA